MKNVFADTCYWIALLNPKDDFHEAAKAASKALGQFRIVTSEMVLVEFLNSLSNHGEAKRKIAVQTVKSLESSPNVEVIPQTSLHFHSAVDRFASRLDKEWSVVDCASFLFMEERKISEALTADHHFKQAGFTVLISGVE